MRPAPQAPVQRWRYRTSIETPSHGPVASILYLEGRHVAREDSVEELNTRIEITLVSAIASFAATNVDDLFVLSVLLGAGNTFRRVVVGQYVGFAAIVGVSAALALGATALPREWIGLLGLAPLLLGLRDLFRRSKSHDREEPSTALSTWSIAAVTFANGGDNIAVYTPLFTRTSGLELGLVLAVFAVLLPAWCAIARSFVALPQVEKLFDRWGHRLAPLVLVALGVYILFDAFY